MREEHKQQCFDLTCEIFGKYEPAGQMVGMTPEIFKGLMTHLFDYIIKQELSIVAIDEATKQVAGVFTALDPIKLESEMGFIEGISLSWALHKHLSKNECMKIMFDIVEKVTEPIKKMVDKHAKKYNLKSKTGIIIEMLTVAVSLDYTGKGIASNLTRILKENGMNLGYKIFYAECSSEFSKKAI